MSNEKPLKATLIGVDYGNSNIGLALGRSGFVRPLKIVSVKNTETAIHEIIRIALEAKVAKFIVGLPLDSEGKDTFQSKEIRKFGKKLKLISKKPVEYLNEHSTSKEALKEVISMGISKKKRAATDHVAAAIVLKRYFQEKGIEPNDSYLTSSHRDISG